MADAITQAPVGQSLSTLYDTVGTSSGSPNAVLETDRIILTHEMGALIASEQMRCSVRRIEVLNVAQNLDFDGVITDLPPAAYRIIGLVVFSDNALAADVTRVQVNIRHRTDSREVPIFFWQGAAGTTPFMRFEPDSTLGLGNYRVFVPNARLETYQLPALARGFLDQQAIDISLRGTTAAFGAGTRNFRANLYISSFTPTPGMLTADGIPFPSW